MYPADPPWIETKRSDLMVTLGSVFQTKSRFLTVEGPKERAQRKTGNHQDATLLFRYRGPSKKTSKLASGGIVRQIGLKMRTKDTCNLIYVMWRIEPTEEIIVTIKSNPGISSHGTCGARGYTTIANIPLTAMGVTAITHEAHRMRARLVESENEFLCTVDVDNETVWSGALPTDVITKIYGPVGFRSDNGIFIFKLLVADEPQTE